MISDELGKRSSNNHFRGFALSSLFWTSAVGPSRHCDGWPECPLLTPIPGMKNKASAQAKVACGRRVSVMRKTIAISAYTASAIVITLATILTLAPLLRPL